ncbi:hypothetical protein J7E43_05690 [Bacillus sp. ISL-8]|nr:hypothetical protein [Bacillus sp. ISL-8]
MKHKKTMGYLVGAFLLGAFFTTTLTACQFTESKTDAVDSQKALDVKEADKAALEYMKSYIDLDNKKMNELHINQYKFLKGEDVTYLGASDKLKGRYELFRYDLEEGSNEYYYKARYYHPGTGGKSSVELRMMKDKKDGKWKNYGWAWGSTHNLESIVGDKKPVQVHKWEGERE